MKRKILLIFGSILLLVGIVIGCLGLKQYLAERNAGKLYEELKVQMDVQPIIEMPTVGVEKMENPIDFDSLTAQYPDVYAWIRIPGTKVDYPIVQREGDNGYYLNHTIDGKKKTEGSIYTEDYNNKDFGDANTVIYGHNMKNGSMFKTLHKYKDKQFLLDNSEIYIYQKDRVLKYKIFAAYIYDSRHLMLSFDFEDKNIFQNYLDNVLTKRNMSSNIDTTVEVTASDKIITLSTCNNNDAQRYLVQAVLLSIQE
jgi:sortase B